MGRQTKRGLSGAKATADTAAKDRAGAIKGQSSQRAGGERDRTNRDISDRLARAVFAHPLSRTARDAGAFRVFWRVAPTLAFGIVLYVMLEHMDVLGGVFKSLLHSLVPIIIGVVLAFIINIPMRMFEKHVFFWIEKASFRRGLSILLCYLLLSAFLLTLLLVVFPQVRIALESLAGLLPVIGKNLYDFVCRLVARYSLDEKILNYFEFDWNSMALNLIEWTKASIPQLVSTTRDITSRVFEVFIGFVLSVYMLFNKERMAGQGCRLCRAVFKQDWSERIINLCALAQNTFRGYMTGMLTEACILGTLTAIGMTIFGFPSPAFAGVLISIGALIPIFGIFIMIVVNAVLIAAQTDILTGLWFVAYIVVLQQLEGNLIYPRVMGNAIRLPGMWVLAAVTVGGTLFGLSGLLLSIPAVSMLYSLTRAFVLAREQRAAKTECGAEMPSGKRG